MGIHGSASHSRAFTLIELLVVIAMIALLMAILLPVLSRVRKQAKAMVCQARLRQWSMALAAYTEDSQGHFPCSVGGANGIWLLRGAYLSKKDPNTPPESLNHFNSKDLTLCPLASQPKGSGQTSFSFGATYYGVGTRFGGTQVSGRYGSASLAWEVVTPAPGFRGSYGLNAYLFYGFDTLDNSVPAGFVPVFPGQHPMDLDVLSLRGRADIPVLLDAVAPFYSPNCGDPPQRKDDGSVPSGLGGVFCMNRHQYFTNTLFLDWSVRKVGLKELWTLYWYRGFNRAGRWTRAGGVKPEAWPEWMRKFKDY
jgi:prepilin-type N-terminal cleavage/methylation domain-containing protein